MRIKKTLSYLVLAIVIIALSFFLWRLIFPKPIFKEVTFEQLPGWQTGDFKKSFQTFQISCRIFTKQNPEHKAGTKKIDLQIKDWLPACHQALKINPATDLEAKSFFEKWFVPVEFNVNNQPVQGMFTGYYMPVLKGSHTETPEFNIPIYQMPSNLVTVHLGHFLPQYKNTKLVGRVDKARVMPFYTREEINKGAIKDTAEVLAWIHSPVDRVILEIQGSGVIEFNDGKKMYIGYDGQTGLTYTSIASVLIKKRILTKDNASMHNIKKYLEAHPQQMVEVLNQNKSFVFFQKLPNNAAYGSQNVPLTPGFTLAVDRKWIPMGMPLWLSTVQPDHINLNHSIPMNRLMIAQDVGGAIRGKVRGDVFWGEGDEATHIASHMKNKGHYWLLIPNQVLPRLEKYLVH